MSCTIRSRDGLQLSTASSTLIRRRAGPRSGSADAIIDYVRKESLTVDWLLETHAHADHLSAAPYLQENSGKLAIGREILTVQGVFGKIFNEGTNFARDGSQFDKLFVDGDSFPIGGIPAIALQVPGHTPADMAYIVGDTAFIGDTMFMPDYGTARADFPGGNASRSISRSAVDEVSGRNARLPLPRLQGAEPREFRLGNHDARRTNRQCARA